jgi:hypothetical protein
MIGNEKIRNGLAAVLGFALLGLTFVSCGKAKTQKIGDKSATDYYSGFTYKQVGNNSHFLKAQSVPLREIYPDRELVADIYMFVDPSGSYTSMYQQFYRCVKKPQVILGFWPVKNTGTWHLDQTVMVFGDFAKAEPSAMGSDALDLTFTHNIVSDGLFNKKITFSYVTSTQSEDQIELSSYSLSADTPDACK